jgi:hypothetical protein
MASCNG